MTRNGGGSQVGSRHRHRAGTSGGRILRWLGLITVLCGLVVLADVAYRVWDPAASQSQHKLSNQLRSQWRDRQDVPVARKLHPKVGQPFAFMRIPKFGRHWRFAIVEGTSLTQLASGPGHVRGTQFPGQPGNFAVAAHDITAGNPFLHLASMRAGDAIYVTTINGTYRYRVTSERVVRYTDTSVLEPVPGHPSLAPTEQYVTLITCTPVTLDFTPWRIVVTGVLASFAPNYQAGQH
ncbi:MAG TPA: class E sortase [Streptosporangiaceae bacterium]|nr:class E sortase [Streptosporangiaceae bacterium]